MCDKQACRVSGHITDPLKQVRQAIKKIAQKNFTINPNVKQKTEKRDLFWIRVYFEFFFIACRTF